MKLYWLIAGVTGLVLASIGCSPPTGGPEPLRVGMELAYPPFEMTDEAGVPAGISVDLARALGEYLGRPVAIENVSFDGLIPALKTGRIDVILSSMTRTEERAASIDFSDPYVRTGLALLAAKGRGIGGIEDLNRPGRTVAVKLGTTGHAFARDFLTEAELLVLNKENACVLEVAQGKADAFIYDQMSVYRNWERHPDTTEPVLDPVTQEAWAIGIRKGNDELRKEVNAFLATFRADGGFDRLADKHLGNMKAVFEDLGYPFIF